MLLIETNQPIVSQSPSSLLTTNQYNNEQLSNIHPRLCTLRKWPDYNGYGVHLGRNEHWRGLRIDDVEPNSPAESGGILRDDIVLAVNGHFIENDEFFNILSFIQHELEHDQIHFLVIDSYSADLARHYHIKIDENYNNCIRIETPMLKTKPEKVFYDQWRITNNSHQMMTQNSSLDEHNANPNNNNNWKLQPRTCSVTGQAGPIGISLQSDEDFGHIIKHVESGSPADQAGIEQDDCIISLNNTILLNQPYGDVLNFLRKNRHKTNLDFLVAKKSYLLKSYQNNTTGEVLPSSNLPERNLSSTLPTGKTLAQLYDKDNKEQTNPSQRRKSTSTTNEQYDPLLPHAIYTNRYSSKQYQGRVFQGFGPATTDRFSWSIRNEKGVDNSSIRSDLYGMNETNGHSNSQKDTFKSLQVGITNPSPKQQSRRILSNIPSVSISDDDQPTHPPTSPIEQDHNVNTHSSSSTHSQTIQNILNAVPITPGQRSSTLHINGQDSPQTSQSSFRLATIPITELTDHGYELHNIKLLQPSETIPVGLKLTKQTDPLQYIITIVVEQSKADLAGFKVDDWLIQIENNDIRLTDFNEVSQNIHQLLNNAGFINMVVARKKSVRSPPLTTQHINVQQTTDAVNIQEPNASVSVGLSNRLDDKDKAIDQSDESNKNGIRRIILKESLGLDFNSYIPDNDNQIQVHFISNVQPSSIADRAGLRDGDRILTVNDLDVSNTSHEDVRRMILNKVPVQLTVINDPEYLELAESVKPNQNKISSSSYNYDSIEQKQSQELPEDLLKYYNVLFSDDKGSVYIKHCVLKKEPIFTGFGFLLRYINNLHTIEGVEIDFPAYDCGLREDDVILFVNNKNVEKMPHDDVKILIRALTISNMSVDLILINKNDVERYRNYQERTVINWNAILSKNNDDASNKTQTGQQEYNINNVPREILMASHLAGARVCTLEIPDNGTGGFSISGEEPPPFTISRIEPNSPAEKAGLKLDDALLSINGKSVMETNYDDTIKIVKEALQQKTVQLVVSQEVFPRYESMTTDGQSSIGGSTGTEPIHRGTNAVQQYQRQRTKELSHTLRLCHLNATNNDGTPASTFGFELTEDPAYEYPVISRVESKLPGELAGLQTRDVLLRVNGRKSKGWDLEKVRKSIEKAKRDGRLEMLVTDRETYAYCKRTNKQFKEPDMKIKHIFPKSRSAANYQKLPLIASISSKDNSEQLGDNSILSYTSSSSTDRRLSIPKETQSDDDEDELMSPTFEPTVHSDMLSPTSPPNTSPFFPHEAPSTPVGLALTTPQQTEVSPTDQKVLNAPQTIQNETSTDESIIDILSNAFNNLFQKPTKPDYDISQNPIINSRTHSPSPPTTLVGLNRSKYSNQSSGSYDYIRDPRRCVLKVDRDKGLGFVLSATGDYDHTITAVEKNSIAEAAGLQANDELVEIDGVNVRSMKYEQVVDMLISAMRTKDILELCVTNSRSHDVVLSTINADKGTYSILNRNNNNNNNQSRNATMYSQHTKVASGDDLFHINSSINRSDSLNQSNITTNHSHLLGRLKYLSNITDGGLSGSVPTLTTGITASPKSTRSTKHNSILSEKGSAVKLWDISQKETPIARLCRIRKLTSSPFYGFYLCGDPKKLGNVFVSDVTKNSPAAVCGLCDGDHIIEINGTNIQMLTHETILNKIKQHMERNDLELLVLDKKSLRWFRERNYSITSRTLPTIVHIQPIINSEIQSSHTKTNDYADRRKSITSL